MDSAKVRINLKSGEIEIEGSTDFVETQLKNLKNIIQTLSISSITPPTTQLPNNNDDEEDAGNNGDLESKFNNDLEVSKIFGEWMHKFKQNLSETEKALITAYYVQSQSSNNEFKTLEISKALKDHGIKLSNPSKFIKNLETKKYTFQVRKDGPKLRFMRVSQEGVTHLKSLLK